MDMSPELKGTSIFLVGMNHLILRDGFPVLNLMVIMVYVLMCVV
jgi:hypothetical protein